MRHLYRIFTITLSLCLIAPATAKAYGKLPAKNSQPRHIVCERLSDDALAYYTGDYSIESLEKLSGAEDTSTSLGAMQNNELFDSLSALMTSTQTYNASYSGYKSGSLAYFWQNTDAAEGSDSYIMFYSDIMNGEGVKLNREHVWPKSRASFHTKGGGSDLHHLRPALDFLNNAKSDHFFGYIKDTRRDGYKTGEKDGKILYYVDSARDVFECKDDVKGDVARILLYVYCRYRQPNLYTSMTENLPEPDPDDTQNTGKKVVENLDTLLEWCELDPVDSWEMERNDLTEDVQGNRNVFIDYPELAWKMFSRTPPEHMQTPSTKGCAHELEETFRNEACSDCGGSFTLKCKYCGNTYKRKLAPLTDYDESEILLGDINGDKSVTITDATILQKKLAGIRVEAFYSKAADTNRDGKTDVRDSTHLQKWLAGLIVDEQIEQPIV